MNRHHPPQKRKKEKINQQLKKVKEKENIIRPTGHVESQKKNQSLSQTKLITATTSQIVKLI